MATCAENKVTADAAIVAKYLEIVGIVAFMDSLAVVGRLMFTVVLEDADDGAAVKAALEASLTGLGYTISHSGSTVVIACS